jgi:hypothetical protein
MLLLVVGIPAGGIAVEDTAEASTTGWDSVNGSDQNTSSELVNLVTVPLMAPCNGILG